MLKRPLLLALALGITTWFVVWMVEDYVPYSQSKVAFIDAMSITGAVIVGIAYPQGVHTGSGVPWWGVWVMVANLAVYVAFWYGCIRLVLYVWRKIGPLRGSDPG